MGHDEAYFTQAESHDFWEAEPVDILADLLQADYTIDTYERRGKRWRKVVDIGAPYNVTFLAVAGTAAMAGKPARDPTRIFRVPRHPTSKRTSLTPCPPSYGTPQEERHSEAFAIAAVFLEQLMSRVGE